MKNNLNIFHQFFKMLISKKNYIKICKAGLLNWLPDKPYLTLLFKSKMGYYPNLQNPRGFNEKLQWLKLHDRNKVYTELVDKFVARGHIAATIGNHYLIPMIGCYSSFAEIDFSILPEKFVLKCTHGSHCSIICTDKTVFDLNGARKFFSKWMRKNYFWYAREWPYKHVLPRIICETFLSSTNKVPEDYKVLCFNGVPKLIRLDLNRYENHTIQFYTTDWEKVDLITEKTSSIEFPKPILLDEMLRLSSRLAFKIPHIRLDWYIVNNKLYFGEFTFYNDAGFMKLRTPETELMIGNWLSI